VNDVSGTISGKYGIFHIGKAQIVFLDADNGIIDQGAEYAVTPLELFTLNETLSQPAGTQAVVLRVKDESGKVVGDVDMIDYSITAIGDAPRAVPSNFILYQNYPNPFNPQTMIAFDLQKASVIELFIFDLTGKKIKTLAKGLHSAGSHQLQWQGYSDAGTVVPSGVYFYQIKVGARVHTRKMILLR
jgi:hypothetical protein